MQLRAADRQTADARDLFDDRLHSVSLLLFEQRRDVRGGPLGVAVVGRRAVSAARALRPPRRQVAAIAAAAAAGIHHSHLVLVAAVVGLLVAAHASDAGRVGTAEGSKCTEGKKGVPA